MPPEDLAAIAPVVVEGDVTRVASGYDSVTGALSTYITVDVTFVHRGPRDLDRVVIRERGGRFGDLVHEVDAVPVYEVGERVFSFLEPAGDGALRTAGLSFGKYRLTRREGPGPEMAARDLSGQGLIQRRFSPAEIEEIPLDHLVSLVASIPFSERPNRGTRRGSNRSGAGPDLPTRGRSDSWRAVPQEFDRLLWDGAGRVPPRASGEASGAGRTGPAALGIAGSPGGISSPEFTPLSATYPARWEEADTSAPVRVNIERARNPLNDPQAAVDQMNRAMAAWTNVPEARLIVQAGNTDYNFTGSNTQSPAAAYPPANIILFGDPYNEITDPSGCSGTLAMGGYWRSGTAGRTVNNVTFYPALRLYVIFNNNFECFLGNADNLAEIATHELGHGIGFGHSAVADAIMRSYAYGNRGPRLGNDDRDGAHCHYPHTITVTSPDGGESWQAGSVHAVTWTVSAEAGPDPGTVSVERSTDGGGTWTTVSASEPNDGSYPWTVPDSPGSRNRIRVVRHNLVTPTPAPYPDACSLDASNGDFTITASSPPACGTAPDGAGGSTPLRIGRSGSTALTLTWGGSCAGSVGDYAVYEGTLAALRSGSFDHVPVTCTAGTDLTETISPGTGDRYYLIAPLGGSQEGRLGKLSSGTDRPPSAAACAPREATSCP